MHNSGTGQTMSAADCQAEHQILQQQGLGRIQGLTGMYERDCTSTFLKCNAVQLNLQTQDCIMEFCLCLLRLNLAILCRGPDVRDSMVCCQLAR